MDRTERLYRIDQLLGAHAVVPATRFLDELGISLATFKRDLEYLRDRLHAPIVWDREARGYRFERRPGAGPVYELPGLWFNASEIYALLTMQHLLENIQPGLLSNHIEPLKARLKGLLDSGQYDAGEAARRIRIIHLASRAGAIRHFETVAAALLKRRRLAMRYYVRSRDEETERVVSPQRLVHYRDNWYLDAWCHLKKSIRSFALDAIRSAEMRADKALDVSGRRLDRELGAGYGIFSGTSLSWARLRFTPERARWVAGEQWHPAQKARFEKDGSYVLELPYSDDRELVMDILREGPEVEVLAPAGLRRKVAEQLRRARARYE